MLNYSIINLILFSLLPLLIKCDHDPSIIVVGAGAAGIAAASRLLENNFTNIIVLEAEGRIGGRIYSIHFGDAMVDLGAQWCHGRKNNVIYELVKDLDLLEMEHPSPYRIYYSNQKLLSSRFVNEMYDIFSSIKSSEDGKEASLGERLSNRFHDIITRKYGNNINKLILAESIFEFFMKAASMRKGTFSLYDVASKNDFQELAGNPSNWKEKGHRIMLDVLIKKYPKPHEELPVRYKTRLYKEVIKIRWDDEEQVILECRDGTSYTADHVIFTPSLGVLKHHYKTLFEPQLPDDKIAAIEDLGIAAVVKVFLHFPVRWWPTSNFTGFSFAWSKQDVKDLLRKFPEGPLANGKHWMFELLGLYAANNNPNVLLAWFAGETVPKIEFLSDEMVINGIMFVAKKFLGNSFDDITPPDTIVRYNWYSNDHFRGTYSFQTVQSSRRKDVSPEVILSQPLRSSYGKEVVLFAGEATHPTHYSSVHGAIESGYREADRIIDLY